MKNLVIIIAVFIALGCAQKGNQEIGEVAPQQESKEMLMADAASKTSSSTVQKPNERQFIQSGSTKFEVDDVRKKTGFIEAEVQQMGGFVVQSNLNSQILQAETVQQTNDKSLEVKKIQIQAYLIVKVPQKQLTGFLTELNNLALFIDTKTLEAKDVSLGLLSNQMKVEQYEKLKKNEPKNTEDSYINIELTNQNIDNKINNLDLKDQVDFSEVRIELYQQPFLSQRIVAQTEIENLRTPFTIRLQNGFKNSWYLVEEALLIIVNCWLLIVLIFAGFYGFSIFKQRIKISSKTSET